MDKKEEFWIAQILHLKNEKKKNALQTIRSERPWTIVTLRILVSLGFILEIYSSAKQVKIQTVKDSKNSKTRLLVCHYATQAQSTEFYLTQLVEPYILTSRNPYRINTKVVM